MPVSLDQPPLTKTSPNPKLFMKHIGPATPAPAAPAPITAEKDTVGRMSSTLARPEMDEPQSISSIGPAAPVHHGAFSANVPQTSPRNSGASYSGAETLAASSRRTPGNPSIRLNTKDPVAFASPMSLVAVSSQPGKYGVTNPQVDGLSSENPDVLSAPHTTHPGRPIESSPTSQTSISGVKVSVGSQQLVLDGTTHAFSPCIAAAPAIESVGPLALDGQPPQLDASGAASIAGQTVISGPQATSSKPFSSVGASYTTLDGIAHALVPEATSASIPQSDTRLKTETLTKEATSKIGGGVIRHTAVSDCKVIEPATTVSGTTMTLR